MSAPDTGYLYDTLSNVDRVLEVGIGDRWDLADRLVAAGVEVLAIDIAPVDRDSRVRFHRMDVTTVDPTRFEPVDAVYARRLPPELHRPVARLAIELEADCYFTTLGGEFPTVEVNMVSDVQETVYVRPADSHMVL